MPRRPLPEEDRAKRRCVSFSPDLDAYVKSVQDAAEAATGYRPSYSAVVQQIVSEHRERRDER